MGYLLDASVVFAAACGEQATLARLARLEGDPSVGAFGAPPRAFVQGGHDEVRAIESGAFWEGCGRVRR